MNKKHGSDSQNPRHVSRILHLMHGAEHFLELGIEVTYAKNHVLIEAGTIPEYCYIVQSGRIVTFEYNSSGNMRVYHVAEAGSVIAETNVLFSYPSQVNFMTGVETKVLAISRKMLLQAIMEYPDVCLDLMESMAEKYQSTLYFLRHGKDFSVSWKVSDLLLLYASRYGIPYEGKTLIQEKISQQMMSDILNVNRVSIVNAITELKNKGLVDQINGRYCVRDIAKLKEYRDNLLN